MNSPTDVQNADLDSTAAHHSSPLVGAGVGLQLAQAAALDFVREPVLIVAADHLVVYANAAAERLLGFSRGELPGLHASMLGFSELGETPRRAFSARKKDGAQIASTLRIHRIGDEKEPQWVCIWTEPEDDAAKSLASAIIESSEDAIIAKSLDGIITGWNPGAQKLFGYTAEEVIGRPVSMLAPPDRKDEFLSILDRLKRGENIEHYETRRQTKDGRVIDISLTVSPIRNASGEIVGASKIARDITARLQMQAALSARERELTTLLAGLPDVVVRIGPDLRIRYISPAFAKSTGISPDLFIGNTLAAAGLPSDLALSLEAKVRQVLATGTMTEADFQFTRADNELRHYASTLVPETSEAGTVESVLLIIRDTTGEQQAKNAQRALERELLLLIEASSTLLASPDSPELLRRIIDLAQRFVAADAYAVWRNVSQGDWTLVSSSGLSDWYIEHARLTGAAAIPADPLVFSPSYASSPAFEQRRAMYDREGIKVVLAVPLTIHGENCGTVTYYWKSNHTISEPELRVARALANLAAAAVSAADLYERELAARQRAENSERRARFLAEAGLLLSSSLDHEVTLSNVSKLAVPEFADWCAVDVLSEEGELVRVAIEHADPSKIALAREFRKKHLGRDDDVSRTVLKTGRPLLFEDVPDELLVKGARSEEHLADLRKLNIRSFIVAPLVSGMDVVGIATFAHSESGRHYSQQDLRVAEDIGRRAGTAIVHARLYREARRVEAALRVSNDELTRLNQDLKQFAFSASHDLQEPLRMVTVYSQLLEKRYGDALDERARQFISFIVQGAKRMEMLIRDLLAYTVAASEPATDSADVDTDKVLNRVLLNLEAAITESHAVIERQPLPPVRATELHLTQLLQNLVANAIKYRHRTRLPRIAISAEAGPEWVRISVADNGIGIPSGYRDQVFGLFKRLHTSDEYPGTGIGLAICQRLVQRYGGQIWVESEEGEGAAFQFTLPAAQRAR